jgi:hypothetical protein
MDPQTAWNELRTATRAGDWEAARELAQDLLDWLDRGGFPPLVRAGASADPARRRAVVRRYCRSAIRRAVAADVPPCECFPSLNRADSDVRNR